MGTLVVGGIVAIIIGFAIHSTIKRGTSGCCSSGGSCGCGGGCGCHTDVKVTDKNLEHYPFEAVLTVDGMTCGHCASKVENALNTLDGVYTVVDSDLKKAHVHMKSKLDEAVLRKVVNDLGEYTVLHINWVK